MWVEIKEDIGDLKKGEILQILYTNFGALGFIGKKGLYALNILVEPVKELNTFYKIEEKNKGWFF